MRSFSWLASALRFQQGPSSQQPGKLTLCSGPGRSLSPQTPALLPKWGHELCALLSTEDGSPFGEQNASIRGRGSILSCFQSPQLSAHDHERQLGRLGAGDCAEGAAGEAAAAEAACDLGTRTLRPSADLEGVPFFSHASILTSHAPPCPAPASLGPPSPRPGPPPVRLPHPQLTGVDAEMGLPGCTKLHSRAKLSVTEVL